MTRTVAVLLDRKLLIVISNFPSIDNVVEAVVNTQENSLKDCLKE